MTEGRVYCSLRQSPRRRWRLYGGLPSLSVVPCLTACCLPKCVVDEAIRSVSCGRLSSSSLLDGRRRARFAIVAEAQGPTLVAPPGFATRESGHRLEDPFDSTRGPNCRRCSRRVCRQQRRFRRLKVVAVLHERSPSHFA